MSLLAGSCVQATEPRFDFLVLKLKYAWAKKVYGQLSGLMTDYLRQLRGSGDVEPFSVDVDEKANALIVLGSPAIFEFRAQKLPLIDIPANAASPPGFVMVQLKSANAQDVAQNINLLWTDRERDAVVGRWQAGVAFFVEVGPVDGGQLRGSHQQGLHDLCRGVVHADQEGVAGFALFQGGQNNRLGSELDQAVVGGEKTFVHVGGSRVGWHDECQSLLGGN